MTVPITTETNQQLFRVLLTALSHPGRMCPVKSGGIHDDADELLLATAQCLMDHEVTFAVAQPNLADLAERIFRRTGSNEVEPEEADFIFVMGSSSNSLSGRAKRGTLDYPDTGATFIYQLPPLTNDVANADQRSPSLVLSGPGIHTTRSPEIPGLDIRELILLGQINAEYPQGVDVFFLLGSQAVMGLPRSTRIEVN